MAITRLAISNPAANTDTLIHTAVRGSVASVIATNKGAISSNIRVWVIPSGQDATPANWIYIAYDVSVEAGNSMETFRFPLVGSDKIYIRSSTADCSFSLNSLYETNGTSNITAQSTAPASPQIGDVWVDTDDNSVHFWSGTEWINATPADLLPSQTGNSGKYLTTNGSTPSWGTIDLSGYATTTALSNHESDTTNIHGISDSSNLVYTSDSRLSDSRTPTSHASSHGVSGSDAITIAQSQVTNLTTDLSSKAPLDSPALTGTPTAPTAAPLTNTTQVATTAFVRTEVSSIIDSAPATLDTLNELAAALGDDPNFATTISTALGGKEPTISSGTTSQYWRGDKTWQTLDKSAVGLGNVENTALSTWAGSSNITTVGTLGSLTVSGLFVNYVQRNVQAASYTLVLSDASKLIEMNVGSANNLTVPLNSLVPFPIGTQIDILQTGTGQTTVVATGGVTINATPGLKLRAQWSSATLIKRATDTWVLIGDISV